MSADDAHHSEHLIGKFYHPGPHLVQVLFMHPRKAMTMMMISTCLSMYATLCAKVLKAMCLMRTRISNEVKAIATRGF